MKNVDFVDVFVVEVDRNKIEQDIVALVVEILDFVFVVYVVDY